MPFDANTKRPGFAESNSTARPAGPAALGLALAAACLLAATGALGQQTVIIGGGPAANPVSGGVAAGPVGSGAGGIVVNDSVLDSLGTGAPAAGLPVPAPQTPVYGTSIATPVAPGSYAAPGAGAVGAFRAPGSGQLVVTRPSTLLHPPMQAPKSRLAVAPVHRAAAPKPAQSDRASTATTPSGKLTSRLIAAPPKARPAAPAAPKVAAKTPAAAKPAAAKPAKTASAPEMPATPDEKPLSATVPAKPSVPAPPPPSLLAQPKDDTAAQMAAKSPPPAATAIAPAPSVQAPSAPPAAPTAPPKAPVVAAPKVAAPAIPSAPAKEATETTVAAIPTAKDQTAARTPGVKATRPGGDLRLTFTSGSAELSDEAKKQLKDLAQNLSQKSSERVQLLAFAADSGDGASRARRLSLSRALAVRAFLIDQGVRSTRMDVRALGSKAGDGPADRVDILPQ